ncbi:Dabb family protein [Robiginitalea sp.]|uniref:Dabb family protein n=1 Tax=Robiginitalea sp. TaxID=1902411 RepID=UPI003C78FEEB
MKLLIAFLMVLSFATQTTYAQASKDSRGFDPAFTHVVHFWLNNPENRQEREYFETELRALFKESKYTQTNFLGTPPKASREVVDDSFTYAMIVTFESAEAQQAYQTEAVHLSFIEKTAHLIKRFTVYDAKGLNP